MDVVSGKKPEALDQFTLGVEIPIAVPPIRVWKALLEPEDMRNWFCESAEVDPRPDGRFSFGGRYSYRLDGPENRGQSLTGLETGRSVTYTWEIGGAPTRVRFVLSTIRGDCRLRVYHECRGQAHLDWREGAADHYPWEIYLLNLKMYLERGNPGIRVDYESIPEGRHTIGGEVRCAAERVWRVLTDREELSRRAGQTIDFDTASGEGWTEPFGKVRVVEARSGRYMLQRWEADEDTAVNIEWELASRGVSTVLSLAAWGEGRAEAWHRERDGMWTHLVWCRVFNELKYYSETGRLTGLRRMTGEL